LQYEGELGRGEADEVIMSTIEVRQVKLASIKLNKDNPRRISTRDMDRLVKSLQEFPDMLREKA
jgi:hypothetical protein